MTPVAATRGAGEEETCCTGTPAHPFPRRLRPDMPKDHPAGAPPAARTPDHARFYVVGLGQCSLDYLCTVEEYPAVDSKCEFQDFSVQGGGPVATALVVLARWGVSADFIGLISDDPFGEAIRESLEQEGVGTGGMVVHRGGRSQFAFICIERATAKRTVFWARPQCGTILPEEIPVESIARADALHLDGLLIEASLAAARLARDRGIPVVLDAGSLRPGMLELVRLTDHLIAAQRFADEYGHGESYATILPRLRELGPKVVVVTLGEKGSIGLLDDEVRYFPALRVRARDTTGAGDVFHGAYIYGLLQRWDTGRCVALATAAAGLNCRAIGGRPGIPSLQEALEHMGSLPAPLPWETARRLFEGP